MKRSVFAFFFLLTIIVSVSQSSDQMKWMLGSWKLNTGYGVIIEQWKLRNDSTLSGSSFIVMNGKDAVPLENIELSYKNGTWYYIPTVKNQNNDQPVSFKVILLKGAEFISENPEHDFPQRIAYRRINNQLFASIEGKNKGKYSKQNFDFVAE